MTAFKELQDAYFHFRIQNEVPDSEAIIIWVRPEYRMQVLHDPEVVRGAWYQENGGRNPVERFLGCPFQVNKLLETNYSFERPDHLTGPVSFRPEFLDGKPE